MSFSDTPQTPMQLNAASSKLPDFWTKSPSVCFTRIEALFSTRGITQDPTKYDYVVSALNIDTADDIQHILLNPPARERYIALKNEPIETFGRS